MPIPVTLRFVGTGKPARVNVNPRINREPSQRGALQSGIKTTGEFNRQRTSDIKPTNRELGGSATQLSRTLVDVVV